MIVSYVHSKNSNHLRSHLRVIMALDHRRLIRPGEKIRPNFLRSTSLLYKILPTRSVGVCKPNFYTIYTSHLRWNSTVRRCFLSYRQDDRSTRGLLAKPLKKFPKSPTRPAGSYFWQAPNLRRNFKRVTLQRDKEFIESIFY